MTLLQLPRRSSFLRTWCVWCRPAEWLVPPAAAARRTAGSAACPYVKFPVPQPPAFCYKTTSTRTFSSTPHGSSSTRNADEVSGRTSSSRSSSMPCRTKGGNISDSRGSRRSTRPRLSSDSDNCLPRVGPVCCCCSSSPSFRPYTSSHASALARCIHIAPHAVESSQRATASRTEDPQLQQQKQSIQESPDTEVAAVCRRATGTAAADVRKPVEPASVGGAPSGWTTGTATPIGRRRAAPGARERQTAARHVREPREDVAATEDAVAAAARAAQLYVVGAAKAAAGARGRATAGGWTRAHRGPLRTAAGAAETGDTTADERGKTAYCSAAAAPPTAAALHSFSAATGPTAATEQLVAPTAGERVDAEAAALSARRRTAVADDLTTQAPGGKEGAAAAAKNAAAGVVTASSSLRPVSYETLASIPWMGRGRLCCVCEQVAERGPYDVTTWNKLLCRAEAILDSLSMRDVGRLVVSMARVNYYLPSLVLKLAVKIKRDIEDADAFTCCGLLHGFSSLRLHDDLFHCIAEHLQKPSVMEGCRLFPLSLMLSACMRERFLHRGLTTAAMQRLPALLERRELQEGRSIALVLNSFARLFNLLQQQTQAPLLQKQQTGAQPQQEDDGPERRDKARRQRVTLQQQQQQPSAQQTQQCDEIAEQQPQQETEGPRRTQQEQQRHRSPGRELASTNAAVFSKQDEYLEQLGTALTATMKKLPEFLPAMDLHSLVLTLNAFSRLRSLTLRIPLTPGIIEVICSELCGQSKRLTALQAATLLNALVKLRRLRHVSLLEAVLAELRVKARHLNPQGVCITVQSLAALDMPDKKLEEQLEHQITQTLHHFSSYEVEVLRRACHRWRNVPASVASLLETQDMSAPPQKSSHQQQQLQLRQQQLQQQRP